MSFRVPEKRTAPAPHPLEASSDDGPSFVDASNLLKHIDYLERAVLLNQEHRARHAASPERFLESEAQLDEELGRFASIATEPELLRILSRSPRWFEAVLPLLQHPNTDIAVRVVALLAEMVEMDADMLPEQYDALYDFCEQLLQNQLLALALANVRRLDEQDADEADGAFQTMQLIESLVDVDVGLLAAVPAGTWAPVKDWLAERMYRAEGRPQNRFYAAELTAILLRSSPAFKGAFLASPGGIDLALAAIARYQAADPADAEGTEFLENLFDILCDAVMDRAGVEILLAAEGVQLLLLLAKGTNLCRIKALRALSFALLDRGSARAVCDQIVDGLGLRVLCPILLRRGEPVLRRHYPRLFSAAQDTEHVTAIFAALLRHASDAQRQRVLHKFAERGGEKMRELAAVHGRLFGRALDECEAMVLQQVDTCLAILHLHRVPILHHDQVRATIEALAGSVDQEGEARFLAALSDGLRAQ